MGPDDISCFHQTLELIGCRVLSLGIITSASNREVMNSNHENALVAISDLQLHPDGKMTPDRVHGTNGSTKKPKVPVTVISYTIAALQVAMNSFCENSPRRGFTLVVCTKLIFPMGSVFTSSRERSEQSLVRWATPQPHDIDLLAKMVDPALDGLHPAKSFSRFADIIAICAQSELEFQPSMSMCCSSWCGSCTGRA